MHYCYKEKGTGAQLSSGEGKRCYTVFRREQVHYCFKEKETGALLFSVEGIWWSTVLRRRKIVHYSFQGEGHWCTTVLRRRKLVHYCYQEKENSSHCSQEKGTGAILFSGEGR